MPKSVRKKKANMPFVSFLVDREYLGKNGHWNPRVGGPAVKGGFQINVMGTKKHYLQLAEFLRSFAEKDTSGDGNYHEHFEGLLSANSNVRLQVIFRKDDVGDSIFQDWFPEEE